MNARSLKLIVAQILGLISAGCANNYAVTFDSFPRGATLVCGGAVMGNTPTTLYFDKAKVTKLSNLDLTTCSANWSSGVRNSYGTVPVQQWPDGVQFTLPRPEAPGLQQDMEFALKVQQAESQAQNQAANSYGTSTVTCTKLGDFSGMVYQFNGFCPVGYLMYSR